MMTNRLGNRQLGFTLIEMMIVVLIIGILAAVAIPSVLKARSEAKLTACEENIMSIVNAEALYFTSHTSYATMAQLVDGEYLKKEPKCPASGGSYTLDMATPDGLTAPTNYTISCTGAHPGLQPGFPKYNRSFGRVVESPSDIPSNGGGGEGDSR